MKTKTWRDSFMWAAMAASCVVSIASLVNTLQILKVQELGIDAIAPANLKLSVDRLRSSIAVEIPNFPSEKLASSKSFKDHEAKVAAYAARLELLEEQNRVRGFWVLGFSVLSTGCLSVAAMLQVSHARRLAGSR